MITVGSDFSGVGAFDQALIRLGIDYKTVFACDMDKYARKTFIENYGEPDYYPKNVYDRKIPKDSLSIYMTSPPCQAFSLAGKRLGKDDKRGILFFNSHEFIQENKPRFFIFENVKGLLSDDNGRTFQEWINYLGGKSVNGVPVIFPTDEAVPYHIYWKVLNAKKLGVPQNRERVFIIGVRDDEDNVFDWPQEVHLTTRLKDVLEDEVDDKYFLSDTAVNWMISHREKRDSKNEFPYTEKSDSVGTITARYYKSGAEDVYFGEKVKIGTWRTHEDGKGFRETEDNNCPTIPARAREDGSGQPVIMIPSATQQGFELATENDSINFSVPNSKTRRGRVGKQVAQTLDTGCQQGVIIPLFHWGKGKANERMVYDKKGISPCMTSAMGMGGGYTPSIIQQYKIRRLTPRECFRLMDFPDTFNWSVSDSQAYKQAGNSIVVKCLELIIKGLKKLN